MSGTINKVILLGHLGRDPEARSFPNGGKVVGFSVATSQRWTDKATGEKKERTEWHNVVIFAESLASVAEQYLRKGSKVYVEGRLETRKWQDQSGQDRYSTEVVLRPYGGTIVLLDRREDGRDHGGRDPGGRYDYNAPPRDDRSMAYGANSGTFDDEIPF